MPDPLTAAAARLSPRELDVIRASIESGGSTKLAAARLGIAYDTARNHRANAYRKLGARSLVDALRILGYL